MCHRERIFQCCQKATGPNTVCDLITWECILLSTATFSFLEEQLSLSLPVWRSAKLLCRCQEPDLPQIQCLVHLGAVPTGPTGSKGFRHFSRTTEQRQWLELLATVINDYCVRAWQPGFTTQVQRRHSGHMVKAQWIQSVSDSLHTQSLHAWQGWHVLLIRVTAYAQHCVSGCSRTPSGDSTNLPLTPSTFLIQQPCHQNDHGAAESSRCHCRKQSNFPIKKNRDGVLVKGNVKFLPSFSQFHETAWEHGG